MNIYFLEKYEYRICICLKHATISQATIDIEMLGVREGGDVWCGGR